MNKLTNKLKPMGLAASLAMASGSASAFLQFGIDETPFNSGINRDAAVVGGPQAGIVDLVANQVDGSYFEFITFTDIVFNPDFTINRINFDTSAWAFFSNYTDGGGSVSAQYTNVPALGGVTPDQEFNINPNNYGLDAYFEASGFVTPFGADGARFNGVTSEFDLYLDPGADNSDASNPDGLNGGGKVGYDRNDNDGDDILIATASDLIIGLGEFIPGATGGTGSFDLRWGDFTPTDDDDADPTNDSDGDNTTPDGDEFFVYPNPFHIILQVDGNIADINPFDPTNAGQLGGLIDACLPVALGGDGDCSLGEFTLALTPSTLQARFLPVVPEPGTLALMGASLLGFGAARRFKKR